MREPLAEHQRGGGQRGVGVAHPHADHGHVVGVGAGKEPGRSRRQRGLHRGHHGQGRILHLDLIEGVLGDVAGVRDHQGDRLADIPHHAPGDGRLEIARRPFGDRHPVGNDGARGHVVGGEDGPHAGQRPGAPRIQTEDARVRVTGAQHHRLEHALRAHVGHEAAVAGEEGLGAQPCEGGADHARRAGTTGGKDVTGG